jgi:hypothetical protein
LISIVSTAAVPGPRTLFGSEVVVAAGVAAFAVSVTDAAGLKTAVESPAVPEPWLTVPAPVLQV